RQADGRQGLPASRLAGTLHCERDRTPGADRCRRRAFRARRQGAARRMKALLALAGLALLLGAGRAAAEVPVYQEVPFFESQIKKGELPPITARLPDD